MGGQTLERTNCMAMLPGGNGNESSYMWFCRPPPSFLIPFVSTNYTFGNFYLAMTNSPPLIELGLSATLEMFFPKLTRSPMATGEADKITNDNWCYNDF
ncbi:unnamed protein product [Urochloa humidicola]